MTIDRAHPGIRAIRRALLAMRSDEQGGYISYDGEGEWAFASSSLGQFTPDEVNALFDLAGLQPDAIEPLGDCQDCAHAVSDGRGGLIKRGYEKPCNECLRPKHDLFVLRRW